MKKTLLEIVQSVLNDMDADDVSSISDTFESEQVAIIVRDTFFYIINNGTWPHLKGFITLTETSASTPTHITVPDAVKEVKWIKYDKRKTGETRRKYEDISYKYPDEFLLLTNQRNNDNSNIDLITDPTGSEILIRNDLAPTYWTSFDDVNICFDSYDSVVDTYVQASKVQCYAESIPTWTHSDTAYPNLPEEAYPYFEEECKKAASYKLKQMLDDIANERSTRGRRRMASKNFVLKGGVRYPDYGRQGKGSATTSIPLDKNN